MTIAQTRQTEYFLSERTCNDLAIRETPNSDIFYIFIEPYKARIENYWHFEGLPHAFE